MHRHAFIREMIWAPAVLLVLLCGAHSALACDSAPADANYADHPYMLHVAYEDAGVLYNIFIGLLVTPVHIVSSPKLGEGPITAIVVKYGDPMVATTPILQPYKRVSGASAVVLKVCRPPVLAARYSILESKFYGFATDSPAKRFFYADGGQLKYVNTTALTDDNCALDITATSSRVSYTNNVHACTEADIEADCTWYRPVSDRPTHESVLYINNQVVGFFEEGKCNTTLQKWTSTVTYMKILPARAFILTNTNNEADQSN